MIDRKQAKKLMSIGTYNTLTELLYKLEHVKAPKEIVRAKESIRDFCVKLFTYGEIFELHDDHVIDLAETLAGLYPEREDLEGYAFYILGYLEKQVARQEKLSLQYSQQLRVKAKERDKDPDGYLDLKYKAWTYAEGYYFQQANMYRLLQETLNALLKYDKEGILCAKTKKKAKKKA